MIKKYDVISIGLGPAGMAVSAMASEMGLKVCAIEKDKIGGECMNSGCIPSKAILRRAKVASYSDKFSELQLSKEKKPIAENMFSHIRKSLDHMNKTKTSKMLEKVELVYGEAKFIKKKIIEVNGNKLTAKKIFICTGTKPMVPNIDGLNKIDFLTNENIFKLNKIPTSMIIIGGGAIGTEMAEAFARLGSKITIINNAPHLIPRGDKEAAKILEKHLEKQGVKILNNSLAIKVKMDKKKIILTTNKGNEISTDKVLVAAGRKFNYDNLRLKNSSIKIGSRGEILVNKYLSTSCKNIYAVGDCNGYSLLSHSAMHQGMLSIINTLLPRIFHRKFKNYVVPWTVFTDPPFSSVGMTEDELKRKKIKYEIIKANYDDYGAAIIENISTGFVKAFISPTGKIYGVVILGEGSGEMINEWALAIQNNIKIYKIMFLQHSFPTMGFLTKRVSEIWMINKMKSNRLKKLIRLIFLAK